MVEIIVMSILFQDDIPWRDLILFVFCQGTIFQFWTPESLRGYGCGTPNGALWTSGMTIQFYIIVFLFHKFLHKKSVKIWMAFILLLLLLGYGVSVSGSYLPLIVAKLLSVSLFRYSWMFFIGAFIAENKNILIDKFSAYWWMFILSVIIYKFMGINLSLPHDYNQCYVGSWLSKKSFIYHISIYINMLCSFFINGNNWNIIKKMEGCRYK